MSAGRRYKVHEALGRGGFGTVYRAELVGGGGFKKAVALKVLNPDMAGHVEVACRFRDEARVLGLIRHRSIVQVDGLVLLNGCWTVVMEYVQGISLELLLEAGPVPPGPALEVVGEVASALHVAYSQPKDDGEPVRLLHRDIKPANIQLTDAGEVKILDFGIARADFSNREAETRSMFFGTQDFMAPERLDLIDGPAGDIYALGAVLYELLTGERFGRTSPNEKRHTGKLHASMDALWNYLGNEHEDLVRLVGDMMAFDPEDRPTARQVERVCSDLQRELGGERLREFAEREVPPLMGEQKEVDHDDLSGATLVEQNATGDLLLGGVEPNEPPKPAGEPATAQGGTLAADVGGARSPASEARSSPTTAPTTGRTLVVAGASAGLAVAVTAVFLATGAGLWYVLTRKDEQPTVPAAVEAVADEAPDEATSDGGEAGGEADAVAVDAAASPSTAREPTARSTPRASSQAESKATTASTTASTGASVEPEPEPAPTGTVWVDGDAESVVLKSFGKAVAPGAVAPGSYEIWATFPGQAPMAAGKVQVVAGATATISCDSMFTRCKVK